jgi:hypothetical protein
VFVRMQQRGIHWREFRKICYWVLLEKSVEKHHIWFKSVKNFSAPHEYLTFVLLTAVRNILKLKTFTEGSIFCISVAKMDTIVVDSYMYVNNKTESYFYVSVAVRFKEMRHNVASYLH